MNVGCRHRQAVDAPASGRRERAAWISERRRMSDTPGGIARLPRRVAISPTLPDPRRGTGTRVDTMAQTLSPALARRIALAAQGFGRPPGATPGIRQLDALVNRLGLLQIDSVNVFERSHYL